MDTNPNRKPVFAKLPSEIPLLEPTIWAAFKARYGREPSLPEYQRLEEYVVRQVNAGVGLDDAAHEALDNDGPGSGDPPPSGSR